MTDEKAKRDLEASVFQTLNGVWRGKGSRSRGTNQRARREVIERDGCCFLCRSEKGVITPIEEVHHVLIPRGGSDADDLKNLIGLCLFCHSFHVPVLESPEMVVYILGELHDRYGYDYPEKPYERWADVMYRQRGMDYESISGRYDDIVKEWVPPFEGRSGFFSSSVDWQSETYRRGYMTGWLNALHMIHELMADRHMAEQAAYDKLIAFSRGPLDEWRRGDGVANAKDAETRLLKELPPDPRWTE